MEDITILYQGKHSKDFLKYFDDTRKSVLSIWEEMEAPISKKVVSNIDPFKKLTERYSSRLACGSCTRMFQFGSTLAGLKLVETKYVLKHRTDEYYQDLALFYEKEGTDNFVCTDTYCHPEAKQPSDHLFLCKTEPLMKGLEILLEAYRKGETEEWMLIPNSPEKTLFQAYLVGLGTEECSIEVIPHIELGDFLIRNNHQGLQWTPQR